jgi:hypothetical protein
LSARNAAGSRRLFLAFFEALTQSLFLCNVRNSILLACSLAKMKELKVLIVGLQGLGVETGLCRCAPHRSAEALSRCALVSLSISAALSCFPQRKI